MSVLIPSKVPPAGAAGRGASPVLAIDGLRVEYATPAGSVTAVRDVSLTLAAGETLGIVGESGSGKSTLAYAVMGYLGPSGRVSAGSIRLHGQEVVGLPQDALRRLRGARMAMVYQDPQTALNPAIPVGEQVAEARLVHHREARSVAWERTVALLDRVGLPDPGTLARRYPHQLSGGQQQRVVIAMGLVNDPDLLILDEPTTGLDVTTEALILDLINDLKREVGAATLYISHNLGVVAQVCDRVAVLYLGEVVEEAAVGPLFAGPRHPYTVGLLGSVPRLGRAKGEGRLRPVPGQRPSGNVDLSGCSFVGRCGLGRQGGHASRCLNVAPALLSVGEDGHTARCHFTAEVPAWAAGPPTDGDPSPLLPSALSAPPPATASSAALAPVEAGEAVAAAEHAGPLLDLREVSVTYGGVGSLDAFFRSLTGGPPPVTAVSQVSLEIAPGETLAIIGESGCGKSSLARAVAGLLRPAAGQVRFLGQPLAVTADRRPASVRRALQMVFQNPDASLNPRHTVGQILERPVRLLLGLRGPEARLRVLNLLRAVQLEPGYANRYPAQLSGGEKQRVSIARAFAGEPRLVICDEAVSALDVSVQAVILNLLVDLQRDQGTSYLFISHDLSVVRYVADRIAVMYLGRILETGSTKDIFVPPHHPYTEALLSAVPDPWRSPQHDRSRGQRIRLQGPVPSPTARPQGCPFAGRCPRHLGPVCDDVPPPLQETGNGHTIACHIPLRDLAQTALGTAPGD